MTLLRPLTFEETRKLSHLIASDNSAAIREFITPEMDLKTADALGYLPLHLAVIYFSNKGDAGPRVMITSLRVPAIGSGPLKALLESAREIYDDEQFHVFINQSDSLHGYTALTLASYWDKAEVWKILVDAGADKSVVTLSGETLEDLALEGKARSTLSLIRGEGPSRPLPVRMTGATSPSGTQGAGG